MLRLRAQLRPSLEAPLRLTCLKCANETSLGKPYCLAHLSAMPYVAKLLRTARGRHLPPSPRGR